MIKINDNAARKLTLLSESKVVLSDLEIYFGQSLTLRDPDSKEFLGMTTHFFS